MENIIQIFFFYFNIDLNQEQIIKKKRFFNYIKKNKL